MQASESPAIEARNLRKKFRGTNDSVLDDVSFTVQRGEVCGIIGLNGSGKSTLLRILATVAAPDSGHIRIANLDSVKKASEVRRKIGYVPQVPPVDGEATGWRDLELQGKMFGGVSLTKLNGLIKLFALSNYIHTPSRTWSGGMKKKLALALGLVNDPEVLLLDEPTAGLDIKATASFWDFIESLGGTKTVLVATHDVRSVESVCGKLVIMNKGKLPDVGSLEELRSKYGVSTLEEVYRKAIQ